ncbi:MAG: DUF932 domain-containing protein [Desulfuromonadaceae bacterium]
MAHELYIKNGKAAIAYLGKDPMWHGLGQSLTDGASIETWKNESGMDWDIKESPVWFQDGAGLKEYEGSKILYRGDTLEQLSIVGNQYKIVQPGEVLEFFRDLVEQQGMRLSTAGVLFGGRRFWALADTGRSSEILKNDMIKGMMLLTTSCDGTMATTAQFTSVRVCCANTLSLSLQKDGAKANRITHRSDFDPKKLKKDMGLLDNAWDTFMQNVKDMSKTKISDKASKDFIYNLIARPDTPVGEQPYTVAKDIEGIMHRAKYGMGSDQAYGTVWGLVNGVTEFVDHESKARIADRALWASWFGKGAELKTKSYQAALKLI